MTWSAESRVWCVIFSAALLASCTSTTDFDTGSGIRRVTAVAGTELASTVYFVTTRCDEAPRNADAEPDKPQSVKETLRTQCWEHSIGRPDTNALGYGTADSGSVRCGIATLSATSLDHGPQALRDEDVSSFDCSAGFEKLTLAIAGTPCRCALIHAHGFNTTFEYALNRTSQLASDLRYPGLVILFSAASAGRFEDYVVDLEAGDLATAELTALLERLAIADVTSTIHVVAHSMGAKTAMNAIVRGRNFRLSEVILAAPDMDTGAFLRALPGAMPKVDRLTVYTSRFDVAISGSTAIHRGRARLGEGLSGSLLENQGGLDVIDATARAADPYAHSYFAESVEVLNDIRDVLSGMRAPDRTRLDCRKAATQGGNSCVLKCPENAECGPSPCARFMNWVLD